MGKVTTFLNGKLQCSKPKADLQSEQKFCRINISYNKYGVLLRVTLSEKNEVSVFVQNRSVYYACRSLVRQVSSDKVSP